MDKDYFLEKAFDNAQEMIKFADSKANLTITIQSLLITIGLGSSILTNTFKIIFEYNKILFWIYVSYVIIYAIISMVEIIVTTCIYKARFSPEKGEEARLGLLYHRHIVNYKNSNDFLTKLESISKEEIYNDFVIQTFNVAEIVNKKMNLVNASVFLLVTNIMLTIILMGISSIVSII